jgi:hypothetical protein
VQCICNVHVFLMTRRVLPQKEDVVERRATVKKASGVKVRSRKEETRQVQDGEGRG